jgi:hypothetical protein
VAGGIWGGWHLAWHWNFRTPSRRRSQARARLGLMPRAKLAREPGGSRTAPGTSAQGVPGTAARPLVTPRNAWSLQAGKISAVTRRAQGRVLAGSGHADLDDLRVHHRGRARCRARPGFMGAGWDGCLRRTRGPRRGAGWLC